MENLHRKQLAEMMRSCYAYGGIEKYSYNFKRYLSPYIEKLGQQAFDEIYAEQSAELQKYEVKQNAHYSEDGGWYNELKLKTT